MERRSVFRGNKAAKADPAAWTAPTWQELVRDHSTRVYRLAYRLTGNREDAEDHDVAGGEPVLVLALVEHELEAAHADDEEDRAGDAQDGQQSGLDGGGAGRDCRCSPPPDKSGCRTSLFSGAQQCRSEGGSGQRGAHLGQGGILGAGDDDLAMQWAAAMYQ